MNKTAISPLVLPFGWRELNEKYELKNDQGLDFVANVLSSSGNVISVFKAKKGLKIKTFEMMIEDYGQVTTSLKLKKKFNIKIGEDLYPIYIIAGQNDILMAQMFIEKDGLFSLVCTLNEGGKNFEEYSKKSPVLNDLVSLIRRNR